MFLVPELLPSPVTGENTHPTVLSEAQFSLIHLSVVVETSPNLNTSQIKIAGPGQCGSVIRLLAHAPKGRGFDLQFKARTWAAGSIPSPGGECNLQAILREVTNGCVFFIPMFLSTSLFPSLSPPFLPLSLKLNGGEKSSGED